MTEPDPVDEEVEVGPEGTKPPTWKVYGIDYDKRGVEWVLWGLSDEEQIYMGKVEANGGQFYEGDWETAQRHWRAFVTQTKEK